jgi:hypothetical protein
MDYEARGLAAGLARAHEVSSSGALHRGPATTYSMPMKTIMGIDRTLVITLAVVIVLAIILLALPEPAPWALPK